MYGILLMDWYQTICKCNVFNIKIKPESCKGYNEVLEGGKLVKVTPIIKIKVLKINVVIIIQFIFVYHVAKIMEKADQIPLKDYLFGDNCITQSAYLKGLRRMAN